MFGAHARVHLPLPPPFPPPPHTRRHEATWKPRLQPRAGVIPTKRSKTSGPRTVMDRTRAPNGHRIYRTITTTVHSPRTRLWNMTPDPPTGSIHSRPRPGTPRRPLAPRPCARPPGLHRRYRCRCRCLWTQRRTPNACPGRDAWAAWDNRCPPPPLPSRRQPTTPGGEPPPGRGSGRHAPASCTFPRVQPRRRQPGHRRSRPGLSRRRRRLHHRLPPLLVPLRPEGGVRAPARNEVDAPGRSRRSPQRPRGTGGGGGVWREMVPGGTRDGPTGTRVGSMRGFPP